MTIRIVFLLLLLLLSLPCCTKKNATVIEPDNGKQVALPKTTRWIMENPILPADSVAGKDAYIVTETTPVLELPSMLTRLHRGDYISRCIVSQGSVIWKANLPSMGNSALVPVYSLLSDSTIGLFWIDCSRIKPLNDTASLATIIIDGSSAQLLLSGAILMHDTGLARYALEKGANPISSFTTKEKCYQRAAASGSKEMFNLLYSSMNEPKQFDTELLHAAFMAGNKELFSTLIQLKIAQRGPSRTIVDVKAELFSILRRFACRATTPALMQRGFKNAFKMAPGESLDTLLWRHIGECVKAAVKIDDTASLSLLFSHGTPEQIDSLLPSLTFYSGSNITVVDYLLAIAEKRSHPALPEIYQRLLINSADFADSSLMARMFSKGAKVPEAKTYDSDLLARCCDDTYRSRVPFRTFPESALLATARQLVDHGASVNAYATRSYSDTAHAPLLLALHGGHFRLAEWLVSKGADVNVWVSVYDSLDSPFYVIQKSPLCFAIERNETALITTLLNAGALPELPGCNVLRSVCKANSPALFKQFTSQKVPVDPTHLTFAALYGSDKLVKYLCTTIKPGDFSTSQSVDTVSPSMNPVFAAYFGARYQTTSEYIDDAGRYIRTISILIDAGYQHEGLIAYDNDTIAAAMLPAKFARFDIVNMLLKEGAQVMVPHLRYAVDGADPALLQSYVDHLTSQPKPPPLEEMYQLYQNTRQIGADSAIQTIISNLFTTYNTRVLSYITGNIAASRAAQPNSQCSADSAGNVLIASIEKYQNSDGWQALINSKEYESGIDTVQLRGRGMLAEPFFLNPPSKLENNFYDGLWFRHYNIRLIDAFSRSLDLSIIREPLVRLGNTIYVSNSLTSSSRPSEVIKDFLIGYQSVMSDSAGAVARYESYFKNPFAGSSNDKFAAYDNPAMASFWTRRLIDGSASSLHHLLDNLSRLFPSESEDNDHEHQSSVKGDSYFSEEDEENP